MENLDRSFPPIIGRLGNEEQFDFFCGYQSLLFGSHRNNSPISQRQFLLFSQTLPVINQSAEHVFFTNSRPMAFLLIMA
jgi:hypothetical protein